MIYRFWVFLLLIVQLVCLGLLWLSYFPGELIERFRTQNKNSLDYCLFSIPHVTINIISDKINQIPLILSSIQHKINMKKALLFLAMVTVPTLCFPTLCLADVYIKYSNKDSQKYVMKVEMNGLIKEVTFNAQTSSAATIQGNSKTSVIVTPCGKVEVKNDSKIEIEKGCIKIL